MGPGNHRDGVAAHGGPRHGPVPETPAIPGPGKDPADASNGSRQGSKLSTVTLSLSVEKYPALRGLPPLRSLGLRPLVRGRGGSCFLCGSGVLRCVAPPFFVSDVGACVGPCVFGCRRALLSCLALFGGLPLDPDYAVPDAKKMQFDRSIWDVIRVVRALPEVF